MYQGEPTNVYQRRRRLLGCMAIGGALLALYAVNGWRAKPVWTLFEDNEGTFAAGDPYGEWIYASCDGEEQQVTVLRDGRLYGAAALDSLRSVRFPNWCRGLPTVDNDALSDWQARLSRLQAMTATSSSAAPILEVAEQMPVSPLYLKPIADWIRDEAHALSFLDTLAERPLRIEHPNAAIARARRNDFANLIHAALDATALSEIEPARLERWLASSQIAGSGEALQRLARVAISSEGAAAQVLERLDAVRPELRAEIYVSLAPGLVPHPAHASLLAQKLWLLPRDSRLAAARRLLGQQDASVEYPLALLSNLRREFRDPDARLELFIAIADRLREEADAPLVLSLRLKDLDDMQRRLAATHLIGLDAPGESDFALATLGAFNDLHPLSRPKFVYTLMQSRQFGDRAVQEACLLAIQLQVRGPAREELLAAMRRYPDLDRDLDARIGAELGALRGRRDG